MIEQDAQEASVQDAASPLKDEINKNEKAMSIINEEVSFFLLLITIDRHENLIYLVFLKS